MNRQNYDTTPRVIFFQVRDSQKKLYAICETARKHFENKEALVIFVEDSKSQEFVNELLWKNPPISFIPHIASDELTTELITITKTKINVNSAKYAFNLCSTPLLIDSPFKIIYDFEDLSHPSKNKFSSLRFDAYKAASYMIESRI